jgi:nitronate monooxygenase
MPARMQTWLTDRFGLTVAVVSAPMFGVAGGRLAAAVSRAGGLGTIGVGSTTTAQQVTDECEVAAAAAKPYGVGLMAWALATDEGPFEATLAASPALVSIGFGDYERYVGSLQAAGVVVATQVGNLAEAKAAEQAGVDVIVARGGEGGGHGRNDVATLPLLQGVLDAVKTPVLAAGGIANSRGLAAVLAAGAAGAWVGTAFLTCQEAETAPGALERLLGAMDTDTAYGRVFDIAQQLGWPPEFGGRALRNTFFDRWVGHEEELASDDDARQGLRSARAVGDFDASYIYTGQGAGLLHEQPAAAAVIDEFAHAADLLAGAADLVWAKP